MRDFRKNYRNEMEKHPVPEALTRRTLRRMKEEKEKKGRVKWIAVVSIALVAVLSGGTVLAVQYNQYDEGQYKGHIPADQANISQVLENDDLKVTIKGISGDKDMVYLTFEMESPDGEPLQENSQYRRSNAARTAFQTATLTCEGESYEVTCCRTDDRSDPARMTFEGSVFTHGKDLSGKQATLTLTNLKDDVTVSEDAGFQFDSLYELCQQVGLAGEDAFVRTGDYITYSDGTSAPSYMIKAGDKKIPFSNQFPNSYIDNVGIYEGGERLADNGKRQVKWLYLSITPGNEEEAAALQELTFQEIGSNRIMELREIQGTYPPGEKESSQDYQDKVAMQDGRIILGLSVQNETENGTEARDITENDLYSFRLVKNARSEEIVRRQGTWSFDFLMDFETKERSVEVDQKVPVLDGEITVNNIYLTNFSVKISGIYSVDFVNKAPMGTTIVFQDGSELAAGSKISGSGNNRTKKFELEWMLPRGIDVDEVAAVRFFGTEIPIES